MIRCNIRPPSLFGIIDELCEKREVRGTLYPPAARVGEHGRGFAVVAGEVRNLAGEAKSATWQIEGVIGGIQTGTQKTAMAIKSARAEVEAGVSSVTKTIEVLNAIIGEAEVVAHGIGEIAHAKEDQASAMNSIARGINDMTHDLKETMQRFRV